MGWHNLDCLETENRNVLDQWALEPRAVPTTTVGEAGERTRFMFFPVVIRDPAVSRESLVRYLEDQIETRFLLPLINQPVYRCMFGSLDDKYSAAAKAESGCIHYRLPPEGVGRDADYVVDFHRFLYNL